jgi:hypothetical protein
MCMQYPWLEALDIPEGRGIRKTRHFWNGDKVKCPMTEKEHFVGVHTSSRTCPGCGADITEEAKL